MKLLRSSENVQDFVVRFKDDTFSSSVHFDYTRQQLALPFAGRSEAAILDTHVWEGYNSRRAWTGESGDGPVMDDVLAITVCPDSDSHRLSRS